VVANAPLAATYFNMRKTTIYGGSNEVQRNIVARPCSGAETWISISPTTRYQLRDAVRRWVDKGYSFERRHGIAKAGGATRAVYGELAELGLAGLAVPEAHGGMGFGAVEAMVVCEELGRGLVNAPYAHGALMAPALLGPHPPRCRPPGCPRSPTASALVVPALQERGARYRLHHIATRRARAAGAGWPAERRQERGARGRRGRCLHRPGPPDRADDDTHSIGLFLVERGVPGLAVRGYPTQDGARAAE
jgi:alkylation response protein AidB-like acyl-CoA dehydrogenase